MRIIPVLDLKGGQVVHARGGDRAGYRPVRSRLCASADPADVFRALASAVGHRTAYVADLDALEGHGDHRDVVHDLIHRHSADVWLDAGVREPGAAVPLLDMGVAQVVVGTETLAGYADLREFAAAAMQDRVVISVDLRHGAVLSRAADIHGSDPRAFVRTCTALGFQRFILLALDRVGTGAGPDLGLMENIAGTAPGAEIYCGGGVRGPEDLTSLAAAGSAGALVATALHDGRVGVIARNSTCSAPGGPGQSA